MTGWMWRAGRSVSWSVTGFGSTEVCCPSAHQWLEGRWCPLRCCPETHRVQICLRSASVTRCGRFLQSEGDREVLYYKSWTSRSSNQTPCEIQQWVSLFLPVRMFLNASSTFVESNADVSINERVFFSEEEGEERCIVSMHKAPHGWRRMSY